MKNQPARIGENCFDHYTMETALEENGREHQGEGEYKSPTTTRILEDKNQGARGDENKTSGADAMTK